MISAFSFALFSAQITSANYRRIRYLDLNAGAAICPGRAVPAFSGAGVAEVAGDVPNGIVGTWAHKGSIAPRKRTALIFFFIEKFSK